MADALGMATQLVGNAVRFSWYSAVNWLLAREAQHLVAFPRYIPQSPVPTHSELMADLRMLFLSDATAVREGLYRPSESAESFADHLRSLRAMFADLPATLTRRAADDATSAAEVPGAEALPDYYRQDFHFQTGGYLSKDSARLYDAQVETLFYGAAGVMRRAGLRFIANHMCGRDQRRTEMLDVACGTGRFLREVRLTYPAMRLKGLDLSKTYLEEARHHLDGLRIVDLIAANAEAMPLAGESQDIITAIFLYHELPGEVRRCVTAEIARVLKPAGLFVFIDSLQMGDRPGWDGLLEAFPVRFHEPYFANYASDDLDGMFASAGLAPEETSHAFLSKVMVRRKQCAEPEDRTPPASHRGQLGH